MTRRSWPLVLTALAVLVATLWFTRADVAISVATPEGPAARSPLATLMTASSELAAHPAQAAAPGSPGDWQALGETIGAWIELREVQARDVHQVVLSRAGPGTPGVREGYLRFGDGSLVHVRLGDGRTVVPITPRTVSSVRFVVTAVDAGAGTAGLEELRLGGPAGDPAVPSNAPSDGNISPLATVTAISPAGADVGGVADGDASTTAVVGGGVELGWGRPREITGVDVSGAATGATLRRGTLVFSDGSVLPLGGVTHDVSRPTVVSFMPRVTTSVRLEVDEVAGGDAGSLALTEVRVLQRGAPASGSTGPSPGTGVDQPLKLSGRAGCRSQATTPRDDSAPVVLCPSTGAVVDDTAQLEVAAGPAYDSLSSTVWSAEQTSGTGATPSAVMTPLGTDHTATVSVDLSGLPAGPFMVELVATGPDETSSPTRLQLVHGSGRPQVEPAAAAPQGRTLVYDEEFDHPIVVNRSGDGADYVAGKPVSSGVTDFGGAAFLDPSSGLHPAEVIDDDYLRLRMQGTPNDLIDTLGSDRQHVSGMISSARPGGSGYSAQYGFFEARMLAPATPGTWPAFWMLPSTNLVDPEPQVAEIDAVELYGHDPLTTCHVTHEFPDPRGAGRVSCVQQWSTVQQAATWHTYGVEVLPDRTVFYVDGVVVADHVAPVGSDDPMFFMLDLAYGGGWRGKIGPVGQRADLYVDWVRVYV